jgi:acetylornithine deacetylase/succinyl-diaminopimelate desuccinylase-like protein
VKIAYGHVYGRAGLWWDAGMLDDSEFVATTWEREIVPALQQYIRIPNKSPLFDPEWREHGHMDRAVELIADFCRSRQVAGLQLEVLRLPERTPLIFMEIPAFGADAASQDTVLLYGHLDKQPEFSGWSEGLAPFEPVLRDGKLYGRGAADDGYAAFAAVTAIESLQREGKPHARCVVVIEACEESGSYDLPAYVEHLRARLGDVSLVICLDSGCGDYERLWSTTSLRGIVNGDLRVDVLREGVHSGDASGVVASSFRIARSLLSRIEDEKTGKIKPKFLHGAIPKQRIAQTKLTAKVLKGTFVASYPWVKGMKPVERDPSALLTNRTWRPALSVTGAAGLPDLQSAGNVLRPSTALKLSLRVPPTVDAFRATDQLKKLLEKDPPYGAHVEFVAEKAAQGWNAPALAPWLERALAAASRAAFGKPACFLGEGGSIPFMAMLGEEFPHAQFFITGVLGPGSNAHGPNEFLHLLTGRRVTQSVAHVLAAHVQRAEAPRTRGKAVKKRRR